VRRTSVLTGTEPATWHHHRQPEVSRRTHGSSSVDSLIVAPVGVDLVIVVDAHGPSKAKRRTFDRATFDFTRRRPPPLPCMYMRRFLRSVGYAANAIRTMMSQTHNNTISA
jgi:hypothetical protein